MKYLEKMAGAMLIYTVIGMWTSHLLMYLWLWNISALLIFLLCMMSIYLQKED